ncbi:MAG: hypothetical protein FWG30_07640 [Eubacteriaceae bacterium]|jgi:DNA invertase Pin-like site-specific DNA recombinase|nr:hypothetical protein [Eubacteriaceae bacterium]
MTYAYIVLAGDMELDTSDFIDYPDAVVLTEYSSDEDRPVLIAALDNMKTGDILLVRSFTDLGMSAMDLIDLSLEAENKSIRVFSVLEGFSDLDITKIRHMDTEAKIEQESSKHFRL